MPSHSHALFEELIRHEGFVRSTLQGLLADEAQVQDALQETWVRVLQRPASELARLREPRTWLARVARNLALSTNRSERRRAVREEASDAPRESGTPAESLARIETRQRVVDAVVTLEEPYRSVVLLRYEEDLGTAEIALHLGRSEATVRSQLSRAHGLLRERLDCEFGDRRDWAVLALPLARPPIGMLPLAAGLAALGAGGWLVWSVLRADAAEVTPAIPAVAALDPAPPAEPSALERDPAAPVAERVAIDPGPSPSAVHAERERLLPTAVLLDEAFYEDGQRATFSFEHGLRDDPGRRIVRGDWGAKLTRDRFRMNTVVNDHALAADLGAVRPEALDGTTLDGLELAEYLPVRLGHTYFFWILDTDTDLACLVHVRAHEVGRSCELDWYATDGSGRAQGSFADDGAGEPLTDLLARLRREAIERQGLLREARVVLQVRMGAGGGNTNKLHMNGALQRIDERSPEPLDLASPVSMGEPSRAYFEGGWIPQDKAFVVQRATWFGCAAGDTNASGRLQLVIGGQALVDVKNQAEPIRGVWTGAIELLPGDEMETWLGIANSSTGDVLLQGTLVDHDPPRDFGAPNRGFFVTELPDDHDEDSPLLEVPRVVLQGRTGACGGNPVTVDLRGRTSIYVDEVHEHPLDFSVTPTMRDDALIYFEGGALREGTAFVVTQATWYGTSVGDTNGHGRFKLVVAGETLADDCDAETANRGSWLGLLRVVPGEESRTYLELANSSTGDVLLTGHFEQL